MYAIKGYIRYIRGIWRSHIRNFAIPNYVPHDSVSVHLCDMLVMLHTTPDEQPVLLYSVEYGTNWEYLLEARALKTDVHTPLKRSQTYEIRVQRLIRDLVRSNRCSGSVNVSKYSHHQQWNVQKNPPPISVSGRVSHLPLALQAHLARPLP